MSSKVFLAIFPILAVVLFDPGISAAAPTSASAKTTIKVNNSSQILIGTYDGKPITCYRKNAKTIYVGKLSKDGKTFKSEHIKLKNKISALKRKANETTDSKVKKNIKSQITKLKATDAAKKNACNGGSPGATPTPAPGTPGGPPPADAFESLAPVVRPLAPQDVAYFLEKAGFGYGIQEQYLIDLGVSQGAQALAAEFMREKTEDSTLQSRVQDRLDNTLGNVATQNSINVDGARRALLDLTIFTQNPYHMRMVYLFLKMFPAHAHYLNPNANAQTQAPNQLDLWWDYYQLIRRYATFPDLPKLAINTQQHVMMIYTLSNNVNSPSIPNNQMARAVLDLMTVGSYCYDDAGTRIRPYLDSRNGLDAQSDVNRVARRLTGWRIGIENSGNNTPNFWAAKFDPADHAPGPEIIFEGTPYAVSTEEYRDLMPALYTSHPCAAQNVARTILQEFVTPNPPISLVRNFAQLIKDNNFNLAVPMATLLASEAFYYAGYKNTITKTPLELMVEFIKRLGLEGSVMAYYNASGGVLVDNLVTANASIDSYLLTLGWNVTKPSFWDSNNRTAWESGTAVMRNIEHLSRLFNDALTKNIPGSVPARPYVSHLTILPSVPMTEREVIARAAATFGVTYNEDQIDALVGYMQLQFNAQGQYVGFSAYDNTNVAHRQNKGLGVYLMTAAQAEFLKK